jgi:hypothetical protein
MSRQQKVLVQWAPVALTAIAGAWTVFHLIWAMTGHTTDDLWGQALLVLFVLALALAFWRYAQRRPALTTATADEPFPEPPLAKFFLGTAGAAELWFVLRMNVGAQWLLAGWEKVREPAAWGTSGTALKGFVAGALAKSGGPHPAVQGWYANFLQGVVQPNAGLFSFLVTWARWLWGWGCSWVR